MAKSVLVKMPAVKPSLEWLGSETRISPPAGIEGKAIGIQMWVELPSELVVGCVMNDAEDMPSFASTLLDAMRHPKVGKARKPTTIRIQDPRLARQVQDAVHGDIPVVVAPTPELDTVMDMLMARLDGDDDLDEDGAFADDVSPEAMGDLFRAAHALYSIAPWKTIGDHQLIRLDVPDLGIHNSCISIMGNAEEVHGFVIFPSIEAYDRFTEFDHTHEDGFGTDWLSLEYDAKSVVSKARRDQAAQHGWSVAGPDAWPFPSHYLPDGQSERAEPRDLELLTRTAFALISFLVRNGTRIFEDDGEPTSQSFTDAKNKSVRLTYPAESASRFDFDEVPGQPAPHVEKAGRNDPCPCGSGKKYKKCCLNKTTSSPTNSKAHAPADTHRMDQELVDRIMQHVSRTTDMDLRRPFQDFKSPEKSAELAIPYAVYCFSASDKTPVDVFIEHKGRNLSPRERGWLEAQQRSWLGLWEAQEVHAGVGLTAIDLLSGETRQIIEKLGTASIHARDTLLARVVDFEGVSLFCGMFPRALPPGVANSVVEKARKHLRLKKAIPIARLQDYALNRKLVQWWEQAVDELDAAARRPRKLANTDGDPFLVTYDRFPFEASQRQEIESRMAQMYGADAGDEEYVFSRINPPGSVLPSTIMATVRFDGATLLAETNSIKRADDLRRKIQKACGALLREPSRSHEDPFQGRPEPKEESIPEDVRMEVLRDFKTRHYAAWLDQPIPALDGQTPREASCAAKGRQRLNVLLKDIENSEQRLPLAERFDFATIRRELGLLER